MKLLSTTKLSQKLNISKKILDEKLLELAYVRKEGDSLVLTDAGEKVGGAYTESKKFGKYIVWQEDMQVFGQQKPNPQQSKLQESRPQKSAQQQATPSQAAKLITATTIGEKLELRANKINFILLELGWLNKSLKGWVVTEQGKKQGGVQAEDYRSGVPYVKWPESIIHAKVLKETIDHVKGDAPALNDQSQKEQVEFRDKFPPTHRSADGHVVRSKAEMLIDNWLYMAEIVHAYERKLPIEEDVYCDFYIPAGKVYIEYWGYDNDQKYLARRQNKIELYKKYGLNLIELTDKEVHNLDDVLPKLLLKYGVKAY